MKKILLLLFSIGAIFSSFSQALTDSQIKKLADLGRVWGLMKYYHPAPASGKLNWNDTLRSYLVKVNNCKTGNEFNALLDRLFSNSGSYRPGKKFLKSRKYHTQTFETGWISASRLLDSPIRQKLENLLLFFRPGKNALVRKETAPYDSNIIHNNGTENLATLIIAWNIIKYEAPHLKLAETAWDTLLEKYIPAVAAAGNPSRFEYLLAEMLSTIRDSHNFMTLPHYENDLGNFYLPFTIAFVEGKNIIKQIDTTVCKIYNLQIGDLVETINGRDINELRDSLGRISRGGHSKVIMNEVDEFYLPKAKGDQPVKITFRKAGSSLLSLAIQPVAKRTLFDPLQQKAKRKYYQVNDNVAYLNLLYSSARDIKKAMSRFHHSTCLIIDNRGYPSGKAYSALFNRLAGGNPRILNYYKQNVSTFTGTFPEKFLHSPYYHLRGFANYLKPFYKKYKGRVIVLFDESTLSHAEFRNQGFSFIKNKVTTVGRNTAGADGALYSRWLPGKIRIAFTGDLVTFPNGKSTQRTGMTPDYYTEDSINSIRNGEDDILNRAIQLAGAKE
ncbi:MAG: hypothetical protein HYZ15_07005 [Sphingobacteriales bacterium]|nr:hypothetical protein [Sphingobacteriales bacterium]